MEFDSVPLTLDEMLQMDSHALHQMALISAGTLTRYRALFVRQLLAIGRTAAHFELGCSSAAHYGIVQLGLPVKEVRRLIQVARELEAFAVFEASCQSRRDRVVQIARGGSCRHPRDGTGVGGTLR